MADIIGYGLHAITADENYGGSLSARERERSRSHSHFPGVYPQDMANSTLRENLCNGCSYPNCISKCGFGREAYRRIQAGEMPDCLTHGINYFMREVTDA